MAVYVSNIVIEQGANFSTTFELEDTITNLPLNLVGFGVTAQIRKSYTSSSSVSFASSIVTANEGTLSISLTSEQTSSLKSGRYVYDVVLQQTLLNGQTSKTRAVEGMALVRGGVTR
jgi:hypothetical protein